MIFFIENKVLIVQKAAEILVHEGLHPDLESASKAAMEIFTEHHAVVFPEVSRRLEAAGQPGSAHLVFTPDTPGDETLGEVVRERLVESGLIPSGPTP